MKKVVNWVKEHKVPLAIAGTAVGGTIAVALGLSKISDICKPSLEHVLMNVGKNREMGKVGIELVEEYSNKKLGNNILGFWTPEHSIKIASAICKEAAELTGETIEIKVTPGQQD